MKKMISFVLALVLLVSVVAPASATNSDGTYSNQEYFLSDCEFSDSEIDFFEKVIALGEHWYLSEDNRLSVDLTEYEIKSNYGFTDEQYQLLVENIIGLTISESPAATPMPAMFLEGTTLVLENGDLHAFLLAAATVGPEALAAALAALGTVTAGPIGTFIAGLLTVLAAPSLIELCGRIIVAAGTGRGVYIRLELDYPPITSGYWPEE